jgi:simple sugar transport system permease protein
MRDIFTISLVFSTIRLATPLVWAAIGGLYSERAGVVNIALEGLMLAGAFTAAAVTFYAHSPWVGVTAASMAGALVALLLAVVCIRFKANEVVAGTGINILFLGLPGVLSAALFLSSGSTPQIPEAELLADACAINARCAAVANIHERLRDLDAGARRCRMHVVRALSDPLRFAAAVGR